MRAGTVIGSLCSGVGGLDLGLERVGLGPVAWHVEADPAASSVLARHWPGVPNLGDIKEIDWHDVEPVDLVAGGIPCQGFSHAGRRQGTADPRWLWPWAAECLRVLRPRWFLLENVAALIGDPTGAFGVIHGDLAELGYDTSWTCLRASEVGAPHRRDRVFLLAHTRSESDRAHPGGALSHAPRNRAERGDGLGGRGRAVADTSDLGHEWSRGTRRRGTGPADGGRDAADTESHEGRCCDGDAVPVAWGIYGPAIARWEQRHGPAPHPLDDRGRLNPAFSEWMMGLPAGWVTDHLGRTAALRCIGNAVVPHAAALAWAVLSERLVERAA